MIRQASSHVNPNPTGAAGQPGVGDATRNLSAAAAGPAGALPSTMNRMNQANDVIPQGGTLPDVNPPADRHAAGAAEQAPLGVQPT